MASAGARATIERLLERASVRVGGGRVWDIEVHDARMFARVLAQGSLGLGESYMDGWWDCPALDQFFERVFRARLPDAVGSWSDALRVLRARLFNLQKRSRAFRIGHAHYDLGNELYRRMLDRRMIYSCAYWSGGAAGLDEAQEAKLDLVCLKLGLRPGLRVLDIGCGWGGTLRFAAERHGIEGVGITVSREQAALAKETCAGLPLEIHFRDYRDVRGPFDRILSLGMFEHVGVKNYRTFIESVRGCLKEDGLFLLQTIGSNVSSVSTDPWIARHIFPNSMIPSARQIAEAHEGKFVLEDWHGFGADYDRTLMAWHARFESAWDDLRRIYDERFRRMWRYYLLACAGSFRARSSQLWQIVFSPSGVSGGYAPAR